MIELARILGSIISNATPLVIASIGETITERVGVVNLSLDGSLAISAMASFVAGLSVETFIRALLDRVATVGFSSFSTVESFIRALLDGTATIGFSNLSPFERLIVESPLFVDDPQATALFVALLVGLLMGALVALLIAVANIELRQDQVAVGFVLTLLMADLAQFLGQEHTRIPGPRFPTVPVVISIPFTDSVINLAEIPFLGEIFFNHNLLVYFSFALIFGAWFVMYRMRYGLTLRAVGERPETAFARGANVNRIRYLYTVLGGALVGLAGASYSLAIKPGWANPPVMRGDGWIALAIVIFGGWHPIRAALGAYLFTALKALASTIQQSTDLPLVLVNTVPWILMIVVLVLVSSGAMDRLLRAMPGPVQRRLRNFLRSEPPGALGTDFSRE